MEGERERDKKGDKKMGEWDSICVEKEDGGREGG